MALESTPRRDRWIALAGALVVVAVAAVVIVAILDARERGRGALEQLQVDQVTQLSRSMEARIDAGFRSIDGLASAPYTLAENDPADAARLEALQGLNPEATTGMMLIDASGTITNGTLLPAGSVGEVLDRPGLKEALAAARPSILPVAPGRTTPSPTVGYAIPISGETGATRGAFVFEVEVGTASTFNQEVAELRRGKTGQFSFVDGRGTVVASSAAGTIAKPYADLDVFRAGPGLIRQGGKVSVVDSVPSAGWRAVFSQSAAEFDGGLGQRIGNAVLILVAGGVLAATIGFGALLRRLRRAREEQRRLEEINRTADEFISIVSHELRTPVAGVVGFLQTTIDHWPAMTDDERRSATERALANARRLYLFSQQILDTSRIDGGGLAGDFEVIDLREEVDVAVAAIRENSPDRLVAVWMPDDPVWVSADPRALQQLFSNLLDNAVKHSPGTAPVVVKAAAEGHDVTVSVVDDGPGLPPGDLERIFERFVRGRSSSVQGTGLGLHIARQIVEAHHGHIWAESTEGRGATFSVRLPTVPAPTAVR